MRAQITPAFSQQRTWPQSPLSKGVTALHHFVWVASEARVTVSLVFQVKDTENAGNYMQTL